MSVFCMSDLYVCAFLALEIAAIVLSRVCLTSCKMLQILFACDLWPAIYTSMRSRGWHSILSTKSPKWSFSTFHMRFGQNKSELIRISRIQNSNIPRPRLPQHSVVFRSRAAFRRNYLFVIVISYCCLLCSYGLCRRCYFVITTSFWLLVPPAALRTP